MYGPLPLREQFRPLQKDPLDYCRFRFPRKGVVAAGSQVVAPPRHLLVAPSETVCRILLEWHSGNMVDLCGTLF